MSTRRNLLFICAVMSLFSATAATTWPNMPTTIKAAYTGYTFGQNATNDENARAHVKRMIDKMGQHGFNSLDLKIQQASSKGSTFLLSDATYKAKVKELIDYAHEKGLACNIYLYPFPSDAGKKGLPFDEIETWRTIFPHAYDFARLQSELGFESLRFDIETTEVLDSSYSEKMAPIAAAIRSFAEELRVLAPGLVLGYMPADHHKLANAFDKALATDEIPAILDAWDLYNGEGYTDSVLNRATKIKQDHPNNRFVPWIRPNSYHAFDVASAVYNAAKNTDGYSLWTLIMLDGSTNPTYALPLKTDGATRYTADEYWAAFEEANTALSNGTDIPLKKPTSLVAAIDLSKLTFPAVEDLPASYQLQEQIQLREQHTAFIRARKGDVVTVKVHVPTGSTQTMAVHYLIAQRNGEVLRDEAVTVGATDTFTFTAPENEIYALVATGGTGGQSCYRLTVTGAATYIDARSNRVYIFGFPNGNPQHFMVYGGTKGNSTLRLSTLRENEDFRYLIDNGKDYTYHLGSTPVDIDIQDKDLVKVTIYRASDQMHNSNNSYSQEVFVRLPNGNFPYVMPCRTNIAAKVNGKTVNLMGIEEVTTTGAQYLDTTLEAESDIAAEFDISWTDISTPQCLAGAQAEDGTLVMLAGIRNGNWVYGYSSNGSLQDTSHAVLPNKNYWVKAILEANRQVLYVNDELVGETNFPESLSTGLNLRLFALNQNSLATQKTKAKISRVKLYKKRDPQE